MRRTYGLITAFVLLLIALEPVRAQGTVDDQTSKAIKVMTSTYGECSKAKVTDCIIVESNNGRAVGTLSRMENLGGRTESTEIRVSTFPGQPAQAKNGFDIDAKSYGTPPTNNVPPIQFWRTERFAVAGQADSGVLAAWLAPNLDSVNGSAFGSLYCSSLKANFTMSLYAPLGSARDEGLVSATQTQLKALMLQLGQAFRGAGACDGSAPSTLPPYAAPFPVLATVTSVDGVRVNVKPPKDPIVGETEWQNGVGKGKELHFGDVVCFRGRGSFKMTWYDGTVLMFSDPSAGIDRGKGANCVEIKLKRPEDMTAPGVIRTGATYVLELITVAAPAVIRMAVDVLGPPPEIQETDVVLAVKGTTFVVGRDMSKGASLVCAEDHVVTLTPRNKALAPFDLQPGNQVQVTAAAVGPITPGCTLPATTPIPQPNTKATGMTIQAGRRSVVAGETVLVPVWLINADNLANLNFNIEYNAAVVKTVGEPGKGNMLDNALFKANPSQAGAILVGLAQTSAIQGTGTLVNIPFKAGGQPGDSTPLLLTVTAINDPTGAVLNINRIAGEIVIVGRDGKVPGGVDGGGAGGPADLQKGDCDGDGFLTELDALCALEMSTQLRPSNPLMDIDNSGAVDSRDAVIIMQRALGK